MGDKIFIDAYGCTENMIDVGRYKDYLQYYNYTFVNNLSEADIIIFFSCGVTSYAAQYCKNRISEILQLKKESAEVLVGGCLPIIDYQQIDSRVKVFRTSHGEFGELSKLLNIHEFSIESTNFNNQIFVAEETGRGDYFQFKQRLKRLGEKEKLLRKQYKLSEPTFFERITEIIYDDSFFINIARGCNGKCTYCAVKRVKGNTKSVPVNEIMNQIRRAYDKGIREIVLAGDDTGSYGIDMGEDIYSLMKAIIALNIPLNISIRNFEPFWLINHIHEFEMMVNSGLIKSICIPLQSTSQRLIKQMGRNYSPEKILKIVKDSRKKHSDIVWSTHLMIGFPSESKQEFENSIMETLECFDYIKHSMYTDRPNTLSSSYNNKIPTAIKKLRMLKFEKQSIESYFKYYNDIIDKMPLNFKEPLRCMFNEEGKSD